jgi:hypothetical protein
MDHSELAELSSRLDRLTAELKSDFRIVVVRQGAAIREDLAPDVLRLERSVSELRKDVLESAQSLRIQIYLVAAVVLVAIVLAA